MSRITTFGAGALLGLSLLCAQNSVLAQNTGGQNQPQAPASGSQTKPDASKQADKPKSDASKQTDKAKSDASKQTDKSKSDKSDKSDKSKSDTSKKDQADKKSDHPIDPQSTDRNRASDRDRSTDRNRSADRDSDRNSDRSSDRTQSSDRSRQDSDRSPRTDRSRQDTDRSRQDTDRSRQDTDRSRQDTDRSRQSDRSRQDSDRGQQSDRSRQNSDRSQQSDRSSQRSDRSTSRSDRQVSAKDLGFAFASQSTDRGLKINSVASRSIASRADFQDGDVIVSVNDNRVTSQRDFIRYIDLNATNRIPVVVLRDDRQVTVYLDPTVIREEVVVSGHGWLGVDLEDRERRAAVVYRVHPESPAAEAGLRSGDVILAVDGTDIRSPQHLGEVVGDMRPGSDVEIEVERNRRSIFLDATLGEKQEVASRRTEIR
jgi:C-terminal processing protease CtpA/Prc